MIVDLRVPATVDGMDAVHAALTESWPALPLPPSRAARWRDEFSLAVAEVTANIIEHAYLPDGPRGAFCLTLTRHPGHLEARLVDRGKVAATFPEAPTMPSVSVGYEDLGERGRGLAIVQATADHFAYRRTEDGENVWTIEKRFPA